MTMDPPELQPRPGEELDPTPGHSPALRLLAIIIVLAMLLTTVGALVFTVFRPLPL